ncbi:VanW family protein [Embleya sp. NPDC056575]|uniref:VanW family protein n=1 Tax=unclassified Embleya TaxID=2699296 RepID=UPI00368FB9EF
MSNDQPPTPDDPGAQPRRDDHDGDPHPFFGRGRPSSAAPAARERSAAPASSPHPSPDPFGDDDEFASWFDDEPPRPAPVAGPPGGSSWPSADDDVPPVAQPPRQPAAPPGPGGLPQRVPGASGARSLTTEGTGAPGPVPFADAPVTPYVPGQPGPAPAHEQQRPLPPNTAYGVAGEHGAGASGPGPDEAGRGVPTEGRPVVHPIDPGVSDAARSAPEGGALPNRVGRRRLIAGFGTPEAGPAPTPPAGGGTDAEMPADSGDSGDSGDQTMTTRVSIKIPGSRPIPPVVLRGQAPLPSQEAPRWTLDGDSDGPYEYRTMQEQDAADHGFPQYGTTDAAGTAAEHPAGAEERTDEARPAPAPPRRRKPKALIACAAGIAVLGGVYGASLAYAGGGVPRGTSVLGVNIGGQSRDEAVRTLEQKLGDRTTKPITLDLGGKELRLEPAASGLLLDARATVSEASKGGMNPLTSVPAMFGKTRETQPRTVVDPVKLGAALEALAAEAGGAQVDGGISFASGQATAVPPAKGKVLDTPAAIKLVEAAFLHGGGPVALPTKAADPKVTQAEVDRAMREFAVPAMSGPVTLTAGTKSFKLNPPALAKYLTMVPDAAGKLQPRIDANGLQEELGQTFSSVGEKPKNATFKVEGKLAAGAKVTVVPSVSGKGVSGATAADAVLSVLTKSGTARTAKVNLGPVEPALTTEAANKLGITEVMSTYTTNYPYAAYRLTNIHRAADLITGSVIKPGDTWSLNKTVGERTAENGFAKGTIINNGRFQTDFGGGVSQVATTTFNAVFFAGLKDVMHRPHSFWIDRYPAGREATVAWPSLDLKFQNDSGKNVYLESTYTDSTVTVTLFGTRKYDDIKAEPGSKYDVIKPKSVVDKSAGCVEQAASDGFKIDVTRVFIQGGKETAREKFHTKYDPADKITCDKTGGAGEGEGQGRTADSPPPGAMPVRMSDD